MQCLRTGLPQPRLQVRQLQRSAGSAAARAGRCGMGNHDMHGPIVLYALEAQVADGQTLGRSAKECHREEQSDAAIHK